MVKSLKAAFFSLLVPLLLLPAPSARATTIDLLGDLAEPVIGPAKEKLKGAMVYVWLQPYAGYGTGSSEQSRVQNGVSLQSSSDLKASGFLWGGRGGILLMNTFRIGIDYSVQTLARDTFVHTATHGTYLKQRVSGSNTMMGATVGFDLPYTPLLGFATRYFKATAHGDDATDGDGWGFGVTFVLKSPFLLSLEQRKLNYSSAADATGLSASGSITQYYANLAFMLF
jgi:hypothetical protein